ncbi:MAG: 4Fe-4S dicluster domain-containing protein [Coriobacteriia bacterium]|nr:4Fe-4S dicluster domain-containing protein [Coriobacteriia bacterium]
MFFRILHKGNVGDLVTGLAATREIVGPKAKGEDFVFGEITDPSELVLDYPTTILPPKKYFLLPKENLMHYDTKNSGVSQDAPNVTPRVIFGVHPCDINSLLLVDKVFLGDFVDPYYKARRDNTLIIGVSCMPTPSCMCNAFGTGEVNQGFDLFLTDLGDRYFVSCSSVEGADMLDKFVETREVEPQDMKAFQERTKAWEEAFTPAPDITQLPLLFDAKYNDPLWEEIGDDCLSCGACSAVCPTCYCFDVNDRQDADGQGGNRVRTWDSCCFSSFAEVAQGHNFRAQKAARVRYRFYHKQWGYLSKFGKVLCVGCGRCTKACKVNINPRRVIEALVKGGE